MRRSRHRPLANSPQFTHIFATEIIGKFMRRSSPRVQNAVKATVVGLLGALPKQAFESATLTTGDALANLMFQLQMTGYMFKSADYRLSLAQSLRGDSNSEIAGLLSQAGSAAAGPEMDEDGNIIIKKPALSGKVKLTYENGQEIEVDAGASEEALTCGA